MDASCRDYKLTRRTMLAAGGATFLSFSVRDLLALGGMDKKPTAEHVILFWNGGGMSHIDTWDPKPGRPTQGELNPISTSVPGIQISEIFPQLARQMQHASIVRSVAGTNGAHGRATYNLQTGYNQTPNLIHPGMGSIVVSEKNKLGDLPAYVTISGQAPRAGYLGQKCEAYYVANPGDKDPYLAFPAGIAQARGNQRLDVLARFNQRFSQTTSDKRAASTQTSIDDAVRLMRSPALEAFELDKVPQRDRDRYGNTGFGRGALLAKRLVQRGVRFVQVNRGGFDTHSNNFPAMENHGAIMDPALAALLADLADTGLLETTMVVMLSEFGRTPRINDNAGRDHWAACFSCLIAGGGVKGGQLIGASDEDGYQPKERPVRVGDLHATLCHALGIDQKKEVMTPLARPMRLVDEGEPVLELFG